MSRLYANDDNMVSILKCVKAYVDAENGKMRKAEKARSWRNKGKQRRRCITYYVGDKNAL